MRTAVAELPDEDFERASGCIGWLVRDLACHLVIDAQDVLITLVTPAGTEPTADAVSYWDLLDGPPTGEDPLDALIPGWPPHTASRGGSSSTWTTSVPPRAGPRNWPIPPSASAPKTRC